MMNIHAFQKPNGNFIVEGEGKFYVQLPSGRISSHTTFLKEKDMPLEELLGVIELLKEFDDPTRNSGGPNFGPEQPY